MNNIAQIIAGALGGVGQTLGDITENRRRNKLTQLQEQQAQQEEQQRQFERLKTVYGSLSPEVDIDPAAAQRFSAAGFSLSKSPSGMARRPMTLAEETEQRQAKVADLQLQSGQLDLNEKQDRAAFLKSISSDAGTMQEFINKPSEQKQALLLAHGVKDAPPQSIADIGAESVAKAQGPMAVQRLQNQGYAAVANGRMNSGMFSQDDVDPAKFQADFNARLARDPEGFGKLFAQVKAARDTQPQLYDQFMRGALDDFRRAYKGNMGPMNAPKPY